MQVAEDPEARFYRRPNIYRVQVDAGRRLSYTTGAMLGLVGGLGA